jgi:hypothetical protein
VIQWRSIRQPSPPRSYAAHGRLLQDVRDTSTTGGTGYEFGFEKRVKVALDELKGSQGLTIQRVQHFDDPVDQLIVGERALPGRTDQPRQFIVEMLRHVGSSATARVRLFLAR